MTVNAGYYGIILDETVDVANKEQLSICFRIVQESFQTEELFLGFYETSVTTSDVITPLSKMFLYAFNFQLTNAEDSDMMAQQMFLLTKVVSAQKFLNRKPLQPTSIFVHIHLT